VARKYLGQILRSKGYCTPQEINDALEYQKQNGGKLADILVKLKFATPEDVAEALAEQFNIPYVDLSRMDIPDDVVDLIPKPVAIEHSIIPLREKGRYLVIAMADPLDFYTLDNLRFILGKEVECCLASKEAVRNSLVRYYGEVTSYDEIMEGITSDDIEFKGLDMGEEDADDEDAPVIKLVNQILQEAIKRRASDVHIEPFEKKLRLRYRIDGMCIEQDPLPKKLQGPILSRIKIMSRMDMAEKRKPQDGRIVMNFQGRMIDFRVSALPARWGESMVLRILDKEKALVDLDLLGLDESDFQRFERIIKRPNGIFLVTGPTGSGKTTTLYAALKKLNRPNVKIITAENPVEYHLSGINQAQVNHRIGYDFSAILRSMLRQAPNIILVGEIRDSETAQTAIQAALTGHLVFSTLHTNDAPSSITRLIDMGVKPFLVASAVQAILAQRLVRKLCDYCKVPYDPPEHMLRAIGIDGRMVRGKTIYRPEGCEECDYHGYRGRLGVFELMEMSPELREMTFRVTPTDKLRRQAINEGMYSLQKDGIRKVLSGITSPEEVLRVTHRADLMTV
jgi:type IV pilus assembly protein PilB